MARKSDRNELNQGLLGAIDGRNASLLVGLVVLSRRSEELVERMCDD